MSRIAAAALVLAAVAATVLLNLVLLDRASSGTDSVGRLSPTVRLPAAPPGVVRPDTGPVEHDGHDD
jgi:hypothetical protein